MMTTEVADRVLDPSQVQALSEGLIAFLQQNTAPDGLFQPDVFCDISLPQWRLQTGSVDDLVAVRRQSHPDLGRVSRWRSDALHDGLVFEFEERWTDAHGEDWSAREIIRATVSNARISEMSVYCTGDWDRTRVAEHAQAVTLLRP